MLPVLRIIDQSCSPRSLPSTALAPTPFRFVHLFGKGVGARSGARQKATLIDYPEHWLRRPRLKLTAIKSAAGAMSKTDYRDTVILNFTSIPKVDSHSLHPVHSC